MLCLYAHGFLPAHGLAAAQGQASAVPDMAANSAPEEITVLVKFWAKFWAILLNFMGLFLGELISYKPWCASHESVM